ncbi:MAG TPA: hypothetical protein VGN80_01250 [Devosiaceae bacterium]|nr:hypothetical protein [Devosiaceae bacterium]
MMMLLALLPFGAQGEDKVGIDGVISDFHCGDNCYLVLDTAGGKELIALCTAPQCESWIVNGAIPPEVIGARVNVRVEEGLQFDSGGNVMAAFPAIANIHFSAEDY